MQKELLRQYISIDNEIREIEQRIQKDTELMQTLEKKSIREKVRGGHGNRKHYIVEGCRHEYSEAKTRCLANRMKRERYISQLQDLKVDIEEYIQSVEDSETRRILAFRYIDGLTWGNVAKSMGDGWTSDACRIKHQRFLNKH